MRFFTSFTVLLLVLLVSCGGTATKKEKEKGKKKEKIKYVLVETTYGDMKLKLYNETPLHRDNFIKLVEDGFYDSLAFHRVIKEFMIQGGDPESKNAPVDKSLGNGGPGYKIDAEFVPTFVHKKGALAAAREGDQVNPEKKSSGSQFYIVHGKPFTNEQLTQLEEKISFPQVREAVFAHIEKPENITIKNKIDSLKEARASTELNQTFGAIAEELKLTMELFKYTEEQKQAYSTMGGTPHLDQNYTVFGEVIEGLNIIDSIAAVETGKANRPVVDVIMKMKMVRK